jgi:hypothetical protein
VLCEHPGSLTYNVVFSDGIGQSPIGVDTVVSCPLVNSIGNPPHKLLRVFVIPSKVVSVNFSDVSANVVIVLLRLSKSNALNVCKSSVAVFIVSLSIVAISLSALSTAEFI